MRAVIGVLLAATPIGCGSSPSAPSPTPPAGTIQGLLSVSSVSFQFSDPSPILIINGRRTYVVDAVVRGTLSDGCTEVSAIEQRRVGATVVLTLRTVRPQGMACILIVKEVREVIRLDGTFPSGSYTVEVNGSPWPLVVPAP